MMKMNGSTHTVTALKRWSCQDKPLPPVYQIKHIHIYDFDNTLFASPLPNKQLWNVSTIGSLQGQDFLYNGGWWHNPAILAATGQGVAFEEQHAWKGYWNERIVELVRLSMQDKGTLTILLTGRKEDGFTELIQKMVSSKSLEFDLMGLKPASGPNNEMFSSTMAFKQAFLNDVAFTYAQAEEMRIYEDRIKHVRAFRDHFETLNSDLMSRTSTHALPVPRPPFTVDVVHVVEQETTMEPETEVAEVQKMINLSNRAILDGMAPVGQQPYKIKRSVFYTGYLISPQDTEQLRSLAKVSQNYAEHEIKYLANNILIVPRPAPRSILNKVGGIGAKMRWKVTGVANHEGRIWAARVAPVVPGAKIYTENHTPCVVLATRRQTKPIEAMKIHNWQPVPEQQALEFETTVGEKATLRIEQEIANEDEYEAAFPNSKNARKHSRDDDFPPLGGQRGKDTKGRSQQWGNHHGQGGQQRGGGGPSAAPRGNSNRGRGAGGFRGGRGRGVPGANGNRGGGRGGRGSYRSLDDNVGQGYGSGGMQY